MGRVRVTTVAVEEHITYSKCVSATLVIQHAKYMQRITLPSVVPFFSTLSHKWDDFRKKKIIEQKQCDLFSLQLLLKYFSF